MAGPMSATTEIDAQEGKQTKIFIPSTPIAMNIRSSFPPGFMFGAATSAFQVEGGVEKETGRGPSIWDSFCEKKKMKGWKEASYHYYKYKEDVRIMKDMGMDCYRFSISWSRVLPNGRRGPDDVDVNQTGVAFYNNLIDELLAKGIVPIVTLFHWDLPQALYDEYGGFLCQPPRDGRLTPILRDFRDYADFCYETFGRKVKYWITLNEPRSVCTNGYGTGTHAPGRCTPNYPIDLVNRAAGTERYFQAHHYPHAVAEALDKKWPGAGSYIRSLIPPDGDSGTEPYIVGHNMLLAHAHAYHLYQKKYKESQKGQVGIAHCIAWAVPASELSADHIAAQRYVDFFFGWFMDPLYCGEYPESMKKLVGDRLPEFDEKQKELLKGTYDFIGVNYYTGLYVSHQPHPSTEKKHVLTDGQYTTSYLRNGIPIGDQGGSSWLYIYRQGFEDTLKYLKRKYNDPAIFITENGIDEKTDFGSTPIWEALFDHQRLYYLRFHLCALREAIYKWKVNVKGYCVWSFIDNLEWAHEFTVRFGIVYCDYENGGRRHKKLSAEWLKFALAKPHKYWPYPELRSAEPHDDDCYREVSAEEP